MVSRSKLSLRPFPCYPELTFSFSWQGHSFVDYSFLVTTLLNFTHKGLHLHKDLKKGDVYLLAEVHTTTSGLKVYVSTNTANDIEVARRSMGGYGYSAFSGFGKTLCGLSSGYHIRGGQLCARPAGCACVFESTSSIILVVEAFD